MEVAEMKMSSRYEARRAFAQYRGRCRTQQDRAIMRCYRALGRGTRVIDVAASIIGAGMHPRQPALPRLAICRAHRARVGFSHRGWDWLFFEDDEYNRRRKKDRVRLRAPNFRAWDNHASGTAQVPLIPPRFRPPDEDLADYHILWEAEWNGVAVDPILLKRVDWPFFAVIATWNLTPIERAVLQTMPFSGR